MPEMPEGTDRNRLVVVVPKEVPEGPEQVVGAAWLQSQQGVDDFEFVRFDGEPAEEPAPPVKAETPARRSPEFQ